LIYRRTKNVRTVQLLLGHIKLESTVRYLGIEVDDGLEIPRTSRLNRFGRRRLTVSGHALARSRFGMPLGTLTAMA